MYARNNSNSKQLQLTYLETDQLRVDSNNSQAFVVGRDNLGENVFVVDTTTNEIKVNGSLAVTGALTWTTSEAFEVKDPSFKLATGNTANTYDIGVYGAYVSGGTKYKGAFFNVSDSDTYTIFKGATVEPGNTVNETSGYTLADFKAGNIAGTLTTAAQPNVTSLGTLPIANINSLEEVNQVILDDNTIISRAELQQLANINTSTIDATQWSRLASMQNVALNASPTFGNLTALQCTIGNLGSSAAALVIGNTSSTLTDFTISFNKPFSPSAQSQIVFDPINNFLDFTFTSSKVSRLKLKDTGLEVGTLPITGITNLTCSGSVTAGSFIGGLTGNVTGNCSGTAATVTSATQTFTTLPNLNSIQSTSIGSSKWPLVASMQNVATSASPTFTAVTITSALSADTTSVISSVPLKLNSTSDNTNGNITSGTWTPTVTAVTNVTSGVGLVCMYSRIGNIVNVSGRFTLRPSSGWGAYTVMTVTLAYPFNAATQSYAQGTVTGINGYPYTFAGALTSSSTSRFTISVSCVGGTISSAVDYEVQFNGMYLCN